MSTPALRHMLLPIALHPDGTPLRIPAIETPQDGLRLVHCPDVAGTSRARAAARHLLAATGLETRDAIFVGHDEGNLEPQTLWHAYLCRAKGPTRDRWRHLTPEREAQNLRWIPLETTATPLSPRDAALLAWIRRLL